MKILMLITGMKNGGAERVMATLCNEFSKEHEVHLGILKTRESDYKLFDVVKIESGNITNKSLKKSIQFVKMELDFWKPDIVLSFMTKTNLIALIARIRAKWKPPIVIAERANPNMVKGLVGIVRKKIYPLADGAIFQTNQARLFYSNIITCEGIILKNPLCEDFVTEPFKGTRTNRIVCVGRLSEEKNQKLLVEAFAEMADEFMDYSVELYGDGPKREELVKHIQKLSMDDRIFLMGRQDHIQELIRDAACFVLPSNSEGMPNALIEAMALGIPCIATDCPIGGPADIIENNKNGLLIPMNDKNALKEALRRCLSDKEFSFLIGKKALEVRKVFEMESVCNEWMEYLVKVEGINHHAEKNS